MINDKASNQFLARAFIWFRRHAASRQLRSRAGAGIQDGLLTLPRRKIPSASVCSSITRFAEYFATHMTGVNQPLAVGDPVVEQVNTTSGTLTGPFAGQSINCRSCHFVTEFQGVAGRGQSHLR